MLPSLAIEEVTELASRVFPLWLLLHAKATALLLLAAIVTVAFARRASAANRHLIWTTALAAVFVLPVVSVVSVVSPAWEVGVLEGGTGDQGPGTGGEAVVRDDVPIVPKEQGPDAPAFIETLADPFDAAAIPVATISVLPVDLREPIESVEATTASIADPPLAKPVAPPASEFRFGRFVPLVILTVWGFGVLALLFRLGWGLATLGRLRRAAQPIQSGFIHELKDRTAKEMGLPRTVALVASPERFVPMTWGVLRPVILVPAHIADWPVERLRLILAHELAHVRRRDAAIDLAAQIAWSICWFNPLAWWGLSRLRLEREKACDDVVLGLSERATQYAETLLTVVRDASCRSVPSAALLMARPGQVEDRVRSVLDETRNRRGVRFKSLTVFAALASVFLVPLAMLRPVARGAGPQGAEAPVPSEIVVTGIEEDQAASSGLVITGHILDPEGKPVANAEVRARDDAGRKFGGQSARTDAEGRYTLRGLPVALGRKLDVFETTRRLFGGGEVRGVGDGKIPETRTAQLDISLQEGGRVTGQVTDGSAPLPGVLVSMFPESVDMNGNFFRDQTGEATLTDADGRYTFQFASPNRKLTLITKLEGYESLEIEKVEVKPGAVSNPAAVVMRRLDQVLAGVVVDADGNPVGGAAIIVSERAPGKEKPRRLGNTIRSEKDGRFRIANLPKTPLSLSALYFDPPPKTGRAPRLFAAAELDVEPGQTDIRIVVAPRVARVKLIEQPAGPRAAARGTVKDLNGQPIAGATVYLYDRSLPSDHIFRKLKYEILAKATTDERGEFLFPEVKSRMREVDRTTPETWEMIAVAPGYGLAGRKILQADRQGRMKLTLGPQATVRGRVVDEQGRPLADAAVSVTLVASLGGDQHRQYDDPDSLQLHHFSAAPQVRTDAEGRFEIQGLPPERRIMLGFEHSPYCREYAYAATTDVPQADLKRERFRAVVDGKALWDDSQVHTGEFTVKLKPGRQLTGRVVLEPSGKPCPGAHIDLSHYNRFHGATTDADGRFAFSGIPDMENRLYVTARDQPNYVGRSIAIAFRPEERERDIEVRLPVGIVVRGTVVNEATGHGIARAHIIQSTPMDERAPDHCLAQMGFTGPQGQFRVVVGPGRTTLRVTGPPEGYVLPELRGYDLPGRGTELDSRAAERFERKIDVVPGQATPELRFLVQREKSLRAAEGQPAAAALSDKPKRSEPNPSETAPGRGREKPLPVAGPRVTARGTVEDLDGQPIAGATVSLREWSVVRFTENVFDQSSRRDILATTTTSERGEFVFRDVPTQPLTRGDSYENPWDVIAIAPGYGLTGEHLADREGKQSLRIKLPRATSLTGRIVDDEGRPLADALVAVENIGPLGTESLRGYQQPGVLFLAYSELEPTYRTDRDGRFRIDRLPRDRRIELKCESGNFVREYVSAATTDKPQPDIVVPGANLGSGAGGGNKAETRKVHTGDFTISLRPGWEVTGRVTLEGSDRPYAGAKLTIMKQQGPRQWTTADAEGRYTVFGVPESGYQVVVQPPEAAEWLGRSQEVLLTPEQRRVVMDVTLPKGTIVTGLVVDDETGAGISGVEVQAAVVDAPAYVPDYASPPVQTDAEGRFRVAVAAGKRRVSVVGPVAGYDVPSRLVRARSRGGARFERFERSIEIVAGEPVSELRFALTRGLIVEGVVLDAEGKPVAAAEVQAPDERLRAPGGRTTRTDEAGRFRLSGLPVGDAQKVNVVDTVRKLSGRAEIEAVTGDAVPASRTVAVEIRMQPTVRVFGKVTDGSRPIPGVRVSLFEYTRRPNGGGASRVPGLEGVTDDEGRFQIDQVDPGREYKIWIEQDRYERSEPQPFSAKPGEDFEHPPVVMRPLGQTVSGIVVDPDGNPVEGVVLSARDRKTRRTIQSSRPFLRNVTGKDGRFTMRELPNVPLSLMAYIPLPMGSTDRAIRFPSEVDAEPGQTDVQIILDPKLQRQRVKKIEGTTKDKE